MYTLVEEKDGYRVSLSIVALKGSEIEENIVELKVDRGGAVLEGPFRSVGDAVYRASAALLEAADDVEKRLDELELLLESDKRVKPIEVYDAVYLAHALYSHALSLRELARRLRSAGLVRPRQIEPTRFALRRAEALRRSSLDLRLLHLTQVQYSINLSMKRLTIVSTLALPALLISSIYGMNLAHLPFADSPILVFSLMAAASALFTLIVYRL